MRNTMDIRILKENFEKSLSRLSESESPNYSKYVTGDIKSKHDPNNYYFVFTSKDIEDANSSDIQSYVTDNIVFYVGRDVGIAHKRFVVKTYSEAMTIFKDLQSDYAAAPYQQRYMQRERGSIRIVFIVEVEPTKPYKIVNLKASDIEAPEAEGAPEGAPEDLQ